MSTYLLYARVSPKGSTWSGTETTVGDQLRDGRAYIRIRDPDAVFIEASDEWATADHRKMPHFRRHMDDLRAGRAEWDALVFRHIDRVGRSALEVIQLGAELQAHGKYFVVYAMPFPTEPPMGPLILGIFALLAEFERSMISERTSAKMHSIAAAGGIPYGKAPFGYRRQPGNNILAVDPVQAPIVQRIFQAYAGGTSVPAIASELTLPPNTILHILRRQIYTGVIEYDGATYPGKHQAIVTTGLWERANAKLPGPKGPAGGTHARPNARTYPYLLSGRITCHCGHSMTPATVTRRRHDGSKRRHHYYRCTSGSCHQNIEARRLDTRVMSHCRESALTRGAAEHFIRSIVQVRAERLSSAEPRFRDIGRDIADAERRLQRIEQAFLEGLVSRDNAEHWNDLLFRARSELDALRSEQQSLADLQNGALPGIDDVMRILQTWGTVLDRTDNDEARRAFLAGLGIRVTIQPDKSAQVRMVMFNAPQWLPSRELYITLGWDDGRAAG